MPTPRLTLLLWLVAILCGLGVAVATTCEPEAAAAYEYDPNNYPWFDGDMHPIYYHVDGPDWWRQHVEDATQLWEPWGYFDFEEGTKFNAQVIVTDRPEVYGIIEDPFASPVTAWAADWHGRCIINLNTSGVNPSWSLLPENGKTLVLGHELGHCLGLQHTTEESIMRGSFYGIREDDKQAMRDLYPYPYRVTLAEVRTPGAVYAQPYGTGPKPLEGP